MSSKANSMFTINTKEYAEMLKTCFGQKIPLYVYGGAGIGKSEIPRQVFPSIAKDMKREFKDWSKLTCNERMDCIKNADKYFIFCDQRIGQMDMTDLRGIPNLMNKEILETIPFSWIVYFTQPTAAGVIFFDELNLAPPVVAGQAYQIIHDRVIADRLLSPDVWVFGAGNRLEDNANVYEMSFPLRDRFCECGLTHDVPIWTEWASANGINSHLIAFINWKHSYLYQINKDSNIKNSTPRGVTRASKLLGEMDIVKQKEQARKLISISVGEAFATEFEAYIEHYKSLDWKKIYAKPSLVNSLSIDQIFALIGGMSEQFKREPNAKTIDNVIPVVAELSKKQPDITIVALTLLRDSNKEKFFELGLSHPALDKVADDICKYLF